MSLHLPAYNLYDRNPRGVQRDWQDAISGALEHALDVYGLIHAIDSQHASPVITRNVGVIAVLDSDLGGVWQERVRSVMSFGDFKTINADETSRLFVAKAIERAFRAERDPVNPTPLGGDTFPAYFGLGRAHSTLATGIAGPYPFHSRLVHDAFHHALVVGLHEDAGPPPVFDAEIIERIEAGFLGGDNGDSGDNTDELVAARQQFTDFAEFVVLS